MLRHAWKLALVVFLGFVLFGLAFASAASAQVVSLDPKYSPSLFASGLTSPGNGVVFRPATTDILVTELSANNISRIDAVTGVVNFFAAATLPDEMVINSVGEVFVKTHMAGGPISRFDSMGNPLGTFSPFSGFPTGMAFDTSNNLYVADNSTGTIWKFAAGSFSSPTAFASGFSSFEGIAFNSLGQLFALDYYGGKVFQVTPGGTTEASHKLWASGIANPIGIAIDPKSGDLFVSSFTGGTILRISAPGVTSTFASGFTSPTGLGFDRARNLYVDDFSTGDLWKFTINDRFLSFPLAGKFPDNTENAFKCDAVNAEDDCVAAISAVFDHDVKPDPKTMAPHFYAPNTSVRTYTSEQGVESCGYPPCSELLFPGSTHGLVGYKNAFDIPFVVNGNYTGGGGCVSGLCDQFLFYTGHAGYDYPAPMGTEVIAPADGLLFIPTSQSYPFGEPVAKFDVLAIDHGNGYASWFLHMGCQKGTRDSHCSLNNGDPGGMEGAGDFRGIDANGIVICSYQQLTSTGCRVKRGDVIGLVGNEGLRPNPGYAHLHFEVREGLTEIPGGLPICTLPSCLPVDPYGWTGTSPDPYSQFLGGLPNIRLWK